jgi:Serine dehydrogenase proteinase
VNANQTVEERLAADLEDLQDILRADCLTYVGPIAFFADDAIRDAIEGIPNKKRKLAFILQTDGGFAETARRISDTLRHHYRVVDFIVPNFAMSAGTILALSGDDIHMDYYSVLGPIDPQEDVDGKLVPALGYVIRYEALLEKGARGGLTNEEMAVLLNFDQAKLYSIEQGKNLSTALLKEWLVKYKFKDWKVTQSHRRRVTMAMKRRRAEEIAEKLNDTDLWNSHGFGINMRLLETRVGLKINDFGENKHLNDKLRDYHRLFLDYMMKMQHGSAIHTNRGFVALA